jgi:RNA polymerase sigma factor (sigma-70 family)
MLQDKPKELPRQYRKMVELMYSDYKPLMLCVAMKIVKNEDHATDIVHSSFESIMKHAEKLSELSDKEVKGFIVLTVKNRALDFIDLHENSKTLPLDSVIDYMPDNYTSAEKEAILHIEIDSIMRMLENLDRKYAVPVIHKYILGYSMEEVAKTLGISVTNAKVRCSRGRSMLLGLIKAGNENE